MAGGRCAGGRDDRSLRTIPPAPSPPKAPPPGPKGLLPPLGRGLGAASNGGVRS